MNSYGLASLGRLSLVGFLAAAWLAPGTALAASVALEEFSTPLIYGFDDGPELRVLGDRVIAPGTDTTTPGYPTSPGPVFALGSLSVTFEADSGAYAAEGNWPYFRTYDSRTFDYGTWGPDRNGYAFLHGGTGYLRFGFSEPVTKVGAFLNTSAPLGPQHDMLIVALGQDGAELEILNITADLPFHPVLEREGGFRGIARPTADIWSFEVRNRFAAVDNLTVEGLGLGGPIPAPVPLPATAALLLAGLAALGLRRLRFS
ncbi:hypothetical protein LHP98_00295 [Rhodobacter sp. Har01]|uniref:hypothetical protein n=1 Tax=Rhodobacter sp. Har01 TaxID=2883999 RepID=UPI001D0808D6|nr:hypothetical protein [Rhodobacter sp. Har01]MCB6176568.1 hypothetical protein [Rhodobacter sp. Har01]